MASRKKIVILGTLFMFALLCSLVKNSSRRLLVNPAQHYRECDIFFMEFFPPPSSMESFPQPMVINNVLSPRMECNVESVIKHDNNLTVCLLMNTDNAELLANVEKSSQSLLTYHNATSQLLVMPMDLNAIFLNTPIFRWWQEELQYTLSRWKINHLSDAARLAFLWKYGGMYLDHDVMVLKSTNSLNNAIGLSSFKRLGTSAMKFSNPGHPFLTKWLYSIPSEYNEDDSGSIGPKLGTKLVVPFCQGDVPKKILERQDLRQISGKFCDFDLEILSPPQSFYPIPREDWELVFQSKKGHHLLPNFNVSYAVHFWHQLNRNKYKAISDIPRDALYWDLAIDNCPKTCQKFVVHRLS